MESSCKKVRMDNDYILFSEEYDKFGEPNLVTEISNFAGTNFDVNLVYIIFSQYEFGKPPLDLKDDSNLPNGYYSIPYTNSQTFHNWIHSNRFGNKPVQMKIIEITISK